MARNFKSILKGKFVLFLRKIPTFVWGIFAVIGILTVGVFVGYSMGLTPELTSPTIYQELKLQSDKYKELIQAYEELSNLYFRQGAKVDELLEITATTQDLGKITQLLTEIDEIRDLINVQLGRIYELKRSADFTPETLDYEPSYSD